MRASSRAPSLGARVSASVWALLCSGIVLAVTDALLVIGRARPGLLAAASYLLLTLVGAAWVAVFGGVAAAALAAAGAITAEALRLPRRARLVGSIAGSGLGVGGVAVLLIRAWDLPNDPLHFSFSVPLGCVLAAGFFAFVQRLLGVRLAAALGVAFGVALLVLDATQYQGLYVTLHRGLCFVSFAAATAGLLPLFAEVRARARFAPFALALVAHVALASPDQALALGALHGTVQPKVVALLRRLLDRDGDGHSAALHGGDCDDSDPRVFPGACEQLGNHRDDNCNGGIEAAPAQAAPPVGNRRAPADALPDVYIVLLDAARADLGGPYARAHSPQLHALAKSSLDFRRAYAPYPSTTHSLESVLRSRYLRYQDENAPDLLGMALAAGYDVQLWSRHTRVRIEPKAGTERAAVLPEWVLRDRAGKETWTAEYVNDAIAELAAAGDVGPRLRWLHVMDIHAPHVHSPAGTTMRAAYQLEVASVDRQLARLVAALERSERGRRAVLIVMADHGEELGEHGAWYHGAYLWEASVHVPLLMRLPGIAPRAIAEPASLLDVLPTLASYLGLPSDPGFQGHDWLGHPEARRDFPFSQVDAIDMFGGIGRPARHCVIGPRYKLQVNLTENVVELYDLERDPGERYPLDPARTPEAAPLFTALARFQDLPGCTGR